MIAILVGFSVFLALLANAVNIAITIQVNRTLPPAGRLPLLSRRYASVREMHRRLFPQSSLPAIAHYSECMCPVLFFGTVLLYVCIASLAHF